VAQLRAVVLAEPRGTNEVGKQPGGKLSKRKKVESRKHVDKRESKDTRMHIYA
jgi:hypothetical protein